MRTYVAVILVRESDGAILIQHRDKRTIYNPLTWCAVGGQKENPLKSDQEEAARELYEETGIEVNPDDLKVLGRQENCEVPEDGIPETRIFYWAKYNKQEFQTKEGFEIRFVTKKEFEQFEFSPGHKEMLSYAFSVFDQSKNKEREQIP